YRSTRQVIIPLTRSTSARRSVDSSEIAPSQTPRNCWSPSFDSRLAVNSEYRSPPSTSHTVDFKIPCGPSITTISSTLHPGSIARATIESSKFLPARMWYRLVEVPSIRELKVDSRRLPSHLSECSQSTTQSRWSLCATTVTAARAELAFSFGPA